MRKYALSKYFGTGSGHVIRFPNSDTLLFYWNGKADGFARYIPHVRRYARNGLEYKSLAALLRAVVDEHREPDTSDIPEAGEAFFASATLKQPEARHGED